MLVGLLRHHVEKERLNICGTRGRYAVQQLHVRLSPVYDHDVIIDRGEIRKRKKKLSKKYQEQFGHLSIEEEIPWKCRQLIVGSGAYGRLPVMQEVQREADRQKIKLLVLPTNETIEVLKREPKDTNAILHVTC